MSLVKEDWGVEGLKQRCKDLRRSIEALGLATPKEVESYLPGGAANDVKHRVGKWIYAYASLLRLRGREASTESQFADAEAVALAALDETPIGVAVSGGKKLYVYPKSAYALLELAGYDYAATRLAWGIDVVQGSNRAEDLAWLRDAVKRLGEISCLLAWIVTTEGPGLPYADTEEDPKPPKAILDLSPRDLIAIQRGHLRANHLRLLQIKPLLTPPDSESTIRPSFATLVATIAGEGAASRVVLRSRSLVALLTEGQLRATAIRDARAEAEEQADLKKGRR